MSWKDTQKQAELAKIASTHKFTLAYGGSRSGKTAKLCQAMVVRAYCKPSRHAILRFHFNDCKRSVGMDTLPNVLKIMGIRYKLNKSDWVFHIPCSDGENLSEIWIGGLDDKDRVDKVLGSQYSTIYLNEASQISYLAYQTALSRLAENAGLSNKIYIDCNPTTKDHWLYKMFMLGIQPSSEERLRNPELYGKIQMNPADNPHLPDDYIPEILMTLSERQQQRFLHGEWQDRRADALFNPEHIESARVTAAPSYLSYAVVGIDPAISSGDDSDETGIISVGMDLNGHFYVLRDDSIKGTPSEWASQVNAAYCALQLNAAVYETNQGGDMVEACIKTANRQIPCFGVRATRGKALRAEPVVALYEQNKVHHVGVFPELEEQMCDWVPGDSGSPDRMDALVWAITYLSTKPVRSGIQPNSPVVSRSADRFPSIYNTSRDRPNFWGGGRRK